MNDNLKTFITNLGILCETWTLTYNKFVSQGYSAKDAMAHTQGFMTAFIAATVQSNGGKNDVS